MGAPYTSVSVSGYNSNPPADDGSAVSTNQVKWSTQKTKLSDPLNTAIASINSNVSTAFGRVVGGAGITSTGVSYAVLAADQGKLVRATVAALTLTFPDATVVGSPFVFGLLNSSAGNITIAGASSQNINGSTSLTMAAGDGYQAFTDGSNWFVIGRKTGVLPRNYMDPSLTLANGADTANDLTVTAGVCRDSTNTVDITVAAMTTGKQLDANWAPGDAAGMRNSAAGITNTTYHIYAVAKADGTQDIYAHTSLTVATVITALQAESGGASYVYARRIGSVARTAAASGIVQFTRKGDFVRFKTPTAQTVTVSTARANKVLADIPLGLSVYVAFVGVISTLDSYVYLSCPNDADVTPSSGGLAHGRSPGAAATVMRHDVWTDTSAQIAHRASTGTTTNIDFHLTGYWDIRDS